MNNKEWLATLGRSANTYRYWLVLDWLMHKYGKCFNDTPSAVIEWLDSPFDREIVKKDLEMWSNHISV